MIFTSIFDQIYNILFAAIDKININDNLLPDISGFGDIIGYSFYFFPSGMVSIIIGNFVLWYGFQLTWAIIEWTYKKIPGVS